MTKTEDMTNGQPTRADWARTARTTRAARATRIAVGTAAVVAAAALLTGCYGKATGATPDRVDGNAAPAGGDAKGDPSDPSDSGDSGASDGDKERGGSSGATSSTGDSGAHSSQNEPGGSAGKSACHTSDLKASVGSNDPGAGQENFALVLTNRSQRTCTVRGFPGLAFVNAEGKQVGVDPERTGGDTTTVRLAPGNSASARLTFSNPDTSGDPTVTPTNVLITPPDETDPLQHGWGGGPVPDGSGSTAPSIGPLVAGSTGT